MAEGWFQDAPTLLAVLDEALVCRRVSRGWRERLGLARTAEELAMPLSEMFQYSTRLRSITQGRGHYSMEPVCYEPVPESVRERLVTED